MTSQSTERAIITPAPDQVRHLNGKTSPWTEERLELLKKYHGEGLSMSLIAEQINHDTKSALSRNAIIGKCLRLALPQRASSVSAGGIHKKIGSRRANLDRGLTQNIRRNKAEINFVEVALPSPDHLSVQFFDLEKHHCRFIKDSTYCGQGVTSDSSWCPFHHRLVYQRPTKPERLAA